MAEITEETRVVAKKEGSEAETVEKTEERKAVGKEVDFLEAGTVEKTVEVWVGP